MKTFRHFLLCLACMMGALIHTALANNIVVTSASVSGPNIAGHYRTVNCSISWDNSWRNDLAGAGQAVPNNYDAAWVFVKFKRFGNANWYHAILSTTASQHVAPSGCTITPSSDGVGTFLYRSTNGTGSVNFQNIQLRWNYQNNSINDNDSIVAIKVMAIEMVYVPQGSFYLGDPQGSFSGMNSFFKTGTDGVYQITSEASISLGTSGGALYSFGETGTLPAAFPKGYNAFYCMKYEISQGQYADFLNTLAPGIAPSYYVGSNSTYRHTINVSNGVYSASRPDRACGWVYGGAYTDWAGLRPMTELEFEKACRGNQSPVLNEYIWGTTTASTAITISGTEDGTETISTTGANANFSHSSAPLSGGDGNYGPLRSGIFARGSTTREQAGATYYGIMDMGGNLFEQCISAYSPNWSFAGAHGDGDISTGVFFGSYFIPRGGNWYYAPQYMRTADRSFGQSGGITVNEHYGFRGVRTAP